MSENQMYVAICVAGVAATSASFVGLHLIGADDYIVVAILVCTIVFCGLIGFVPDDGSHRRR